MVISKGIAQHAKLTNTGDLTTTKTTGGERGETLYVRAVETTINH